VRTLFWCLFCSLILAGCGADRPNVNFDALAEEFVYSTLGMSPVMATSVGYHEHNGVVLDAQLDDVSETALEQQRLLYRDYREQLTSGLDPDSLLPEQRADLAIILDQIDTSLLELDVIQAYRHNPTIYVELVGYALFDPFVREYAPLPERYGHIISRIGQIPALVEQAETNLLDAPEIWTTVALEENEGNLSLIDETLRDAAPPELREAYDNAADPALASLRGLSDFLQNNLSRRTSDWRLGAENYARKFQYVLATDATPEEVLQDAEAELASVRDEMHRIATPLHAEWFPNHNHPDDLNTVVRETLDRIAERHATPETYFLEAKRDLAEITNFVEETNLVPLVATDNLEVIETPEFMRGIYSVGGFNAAPALEPELGAYYWLTPIPEDWSQDRIDSKLREYNYYGLKLLTIHEAMPGHWVQFEYANRIEPETRRLLRAVFGNSAYIEGWAVYGTEMLLDEGYLDNSPELRLTFLKQQLRVISNAILDIRLQTMGMTDDEAMRLMLEDTFQEQEEASGKLRRAKLSSCQLPTYYVGWRDWHRLRSQFMEATGDAFDATTFHEAALEAGPVPVPVLAQLMLGEALAE